MPRPRRRNGVLRLPVPAYHQTFEFSCGPASLLMAMGTFDKRLVLDRASEIDIWRTATVVEVGGCSQFGVALAAHKAGHRVRLLTTTEQLPFRDRAVAFFKQIDVTLMDTLYADTVKKCRAARIPVELREFGVEEVEAALKRHEVPILYTTTKIAGDDDIPHWVVVSGMRRDGSAFFIHNPYKDSKQMGDAVSRATLEKYFGFDGARAVVLVGPRRASARGPRRR
ncbi:MAG: peptidase C39 family protein [Methanobacteriota archaeon]